MNRLALLVGASALVLSLSSCADASNQDDGNSADARPPNTPDAELAVADAVSPDADLAGFVQVDSSSDFPAPMMSITDFDDAELLAAGITATGFSSGSGSLLGNATAPMASPFVFPRAMGSTFEFASPVAGAGFSITDADFGNDSLVVVTLLALDAGDEEVGSVTVTVQPANSAEEENTNARFVGFLSPSPVTTLRISWDQEDNSMVLDNLLYR